MPKFDQVWVEKMSLLDKLLLDWEIIENFVKMALLQFGPCNLQSIPVYDGLECVVLNLSLSKMV